MSAEGAPLPPPAPEAVAAEMPAPRTFEYNDQQFIGVEVRADGRQFWGRNGGGKLVRVSDDVGRGFLEGRLGKEPQQLDATEAPVNSWTAQEVPKTADEMRAEADSNTSLAEEGTPASSANPTPAETSSGNAWAAPTIPKPKVSTPPPPTAPQPSTKEDTGSDGSSDSNIPKHIKDRLLRQREERQRSEPDVAPSTNEPAPASTIPKHIKDRLLRQREERQRSEPDVAPSTNEPAPASTPKGPEPFAPPAEGTPHLSAEQMRQHGRDRAYEAWANTEPIVSDLVNELVDKGVFGSRSKADALDALKERHQFESDRATSRGEASQDFEAFVRKELNEVRLREQAQKARDAQKQQTQQATADRGNTHGIPEHLLERSRRAREAYETRKAAEAANNLSSREQLTKDFIDIARRRSLRLAHGASDEQIEAKLQEDYNRLASRTTAKGETPPTFEEWLSKRIAANTPKTKAQGAGNAQPSNPSTEPQLDQARLEQEQRINDLIYRVHAALSSEGRTMGEVIDGLNAWYDSYKQRTAPEDIMPYEEWLELQAERFEAIRQNTDPQTDPSNDHTDHDKHHNDHEHDHHPVKESRLRRLGKWGIGASMIIGTPYALAVGGSVVAGISTDELSKRAKLPGILLNPWEMLTDPYSRNLYLPLGIIALNTAVGTKGVINLFRRIDGRTRDPAELTRRSRIASRLSEGRSQRGSERRARHLDDLLGSLENNEVYKNLLDNDSEHVFLGTDTNDQNEQVYKFREADGQEIALTRDEIGNRLFPGLDTTPRRRRGRRSNRQDQGDSGNDADPSTEQELHQAAVQGVLQAAWEQGSFSGVQWNYVANGETLSARVVDSDLDNRTVTIEFKNEAGQIVSVFTTDEAEFMTNLEDSAYSSDVRYINPNTVVPSANLSFDNPDLAARTDDIFDAAESRPDGFVGLSFVKRGEGQRKVIAVNSSGRLVIELESGGTTTMTPERFREYLLRTDHTLENIRFD